MENDFNQSNSKRKKVLQIVIPAFLALLCGLFIYQYWSQKGGNKSTDESLSLPAVNATTPNRPLTDSFLTKQEVYTAQDDAKNLEKQKKEEFSRGSDKFGKINTNVLGEGDAKTLQKRISNEVVNPSLESEAKNTHQDPPRSVPVKTKQEPIKVNTDNDIGIKRGFNSFVMKKGPSQATSTPGNDTKDLGNYSSPSNSNTDFNCEAIITNKSKISSRGSVIITLQDNLSIQNGIKLPAGTEIAARASVMDERVMLEIESANINGKIVKLSLKAYDLDGMEGLFVKDAQLQKGATSSTNNAIVSLSNLGESAFGIPGQLAGGIIRSLTGGGTGGGSVTLPKGYKMILKSKY